MKILTKKGTAMTPAGSPVNRRRKGTLAAWLLLSLACVGARAETTTEKLETARQLVDLLEYRETFDSALAQCRSPGIQSYDPAVMLENNPAVFRGITTRSAYWPEIQAAYRRSQLRACAYLSAEDSARFMAQQFADRTSLDDLRAALQFYSTPAGRRLQKAGRAVNDAYQVYANAAMDKSAMEAHKQVEDEVAAIIKRYLQTPR